MDVTFDQTDEANPIGDDNDQKYILRDSLMFVLDASPPMFKSKCFEQCLKMYRKILSEKCSSNKKDKMGLIIFGTNVPDCNIENVKILQELDTTSLDGLKSIDTLCRNHCGKYEENASDTKYPLYNALMHALKQLQLLKSTDTSRRIIILCTCISNPSSKISTQEQRQLENMIASLKDNNVEFFVTGPENWDDEVYYKDLQMISNDNYKKLHLQDLENYISNPARKVMSIPWKVSADVVVDCGIYSLISVPKMPRKERLNKSDNSLLVKQNILTDGGRDDDSGTEEFEEDNIYDEKDVMYYQNFGNSDIFFKAEEKKALKNLGLKPVIEILAFKQVKCDPLYYIRSSHFLTCSFDCNHETKTFFMAFVSRCHAKKVMAVCKVVTNSNVLIMCMIPSEDDGGFYMFDLPCDENEHDSSHLSEYVFNDDNKCPLNHEAAQCFRDLIEQDKVEFNPRLFKNPKLAIIKAHIEALALGKHLESSPMDTSLPPLSEGSTDLTSRLKLLLDLQEEEGSFNKRSQSQTQGSGASKKFKHFR